MHTNKKKRYRYLFCSINILFQGRDWEEAEKSLEFFKNTRGFKKIFFFSFQPKSDSHIF